MVRPELQHPLFDLKSETVPDRLEVSVLFGEFWGRRATSGEARAHGPEALSRRRSSPRGVAPRRHRKPLRRHHGGERGSDPADRSGGSRGRCGVGRIPWPVRPSWPERVPSPGLAPEAGRSLPRARNRPVAVGDTPVREPLRPWADVAVSDIRRRLLRQAVDAVALGDRSADPGAQGPHQRGWDVGVGDRFTGKRAGKGLRRRLPPKSVAQTDTARCRDRSSLS